MKKSVLAITLALTSTLTLASPLTWTDADKEWTTPEGVVITFEEVAFYSPQVFCEKIASGSRALVSARIAGVNIKELSDLADYPLYPSHLKDEILTMNVSGYSDSDRLRERQLDLFESEIDVKCLKGILMEMRK